jgi:hypothetical protein
MTVADRIDGLTPLHLAVEAGNIDVIDYLIAAGSDVNTSTRSAIDDASAGSSSSGGAARGKSELPRR